jgi:hypothetical protein
VTQEKDFRLALPPLVCRALKPDEWHETYLADIAREHGVRRPTSTDVKWLLYRTNTLRLGQQEAEGDAHLVHMLNGGYPRYGGSHVPKYAGFSRFTAARYCPYCILEDRYHRGRWRLKDYLICTRHKCFLKLDPSVLASLDAQTCRGSRPLSEFSEAELLVGTQDSSSDELRVHQLIWGELERCLEGIPPSELQNKAVGDLVAWSILSWSLIYRVARIYFHRVKSQPFKGPLECIVNFFDATGFEIGASRAGVLIFFRCLNAHPTYAGAMRYLREIQRMERARPSLLSRVNFDSLYEAAVGARPEVCVKPPAYRACFVREDGLGMSFKLFGKLIGVSGATVALWARSGRIQTEKRSNKANSQADFIPAREVDAHLRFRRALITKEEFIRANGLSLGTGEVLYKSGILRTVSYAHCCFVVKESISNLMLRLELQSAPSEQGVSKIRMSLLGQEVSSIAWVASDLIALMEAAIAGDLRIFRSLERSGLSSFEIDDQGLTWLLRRIKHRRTKYLRATEAEAAASTSLFEEDGDDR